MKVIILGAGLSGISLAYFLQEKEEITSIDIIEREDDVGGLCRSFHIGPYTYDIGPHILFSKDKEMLQLMQDVLPEKNRLKRSNQIIYKGQYVKYPFENDLSKLPEEELQYCVTAFQNNPYREYTAENMLQFFLKIFGEGITNIYLRPYNEKIWKYDPVFMDTQMVERIPQPTDEEIMRSATGETIDGYVHQLYFDYPSKGGIETVVKGFQKRLSKKCKIHLNENITAIIKEKEEFCVRTEKGEFQSDWLISTIPVQELTKCYKVVPDEIKMVVDALKYNSIIIAFVKTKENLSGDNFAFMNPEKEIIFHRISKMDFLGEAYQSDSATYMIEVTYRKGDYTDSLTEEQLKTKISEGIVQINFAKEISDIEFINITRHPYAYVIYELNHQTNMKKIRDFYQKEGIYLNGRFGNFEYWNMDRVLRESKNMVENLCTSYFI